MLGGARYKLHHACVFFGALGRMLVVTSYVSAAAGAAAHGCYCLLRFLRVRGPLNPPGDYEVGMGTRAGPMLKGRGQFWALRTRVCFARPPAGSVFRAAMHNAFLGQRGVAKTQSFRALSPKYLTGPVPTKVMSGDSLGGGAHGLR